jgi:hypothetical protein
MSRHLKREDVLVVNMFRVLVARMTVVAADESGMSTVEYSTAMDYTIATGE